MIFNDDMDWGLTEEDHELIEKILDIDRNAGCGYVSNYDNSPVECRICNKLCLIGQHYCEDHMYLVENLKNRLRDIEKKRSKRTNKNQCKMDDCKKKPYANGLCRHHYGMKSYGSNYTGKE